MSAGKRYLIVTERVTFQGALNKLVFQYLICFFINVLKAARRHLSNSHSSALSILILSVNCIGVIAIARPAPMYSSVIIICLSVKV